MDDVRTVQVRMKEWLAEMNGVISRQRGQRSTQRGSTESSPKPLIHTSAVLLGELTQHPYCLMCMQVLLRRSSPPGSGAARLPRLNPRQYFGFTLQGNDQALSRAATRK